MDAGTGEPSVDDFCRLCLHQYGSEKMRPLRSFSAAAHQSIAHLLVLTCGLMPANLDDGLPQRICMDCLGQLEQTYRFPRQSKDNESILVRFRSDGSVLQRLIDYQSYGAGPSGQPPPIRNSNSAQVCSSALSAAVLEPETSQRIHKRTRPEQERTSLNTSTLNAIPMPQPIMVDDDSEVKVVVVEQQPQRTANGRASRTSGEISSLTQQPPRQKCHSNIKYIRINGRFRCPSCPYVHASRNTFVRHMGVHRAVLEERFKCKRCGKIFCYADSLRNHIKNVKCT